MDVICCCEMRWRPKESSHIIKHKEDEKNIVYFGFLLHHTLSAISYAAGLFLGRLHFWGCFAGTCEISNILVAIIIINRGTKSACMYHCQNVAALALYALTRLVLFAVWLFLWINDFSFDLEFSSQLTLFERTFYPSVIIFLWLFSAYSMLHLVQAYRSGIRRSSEIKQQ